MPLRTTSSPASPPPWPPCPALFAHLVHPAHSDAWSLIRLLPDDPDGRTSSHDPADPGSEHPGRPAVPPPALTSFPPLAPTRGRLSDCSRTILMEGPHPMPQPIQALNILGAQTPTSTSSAPAAETSPAEGDTVHQVVVVGSGPAG